MTWSNKLKRLTSLDALEPADHTNCVKLTLDFTGYLSGLGEESLNSVTTVGPPRVSAASQGMVIEQDYWPPYIHFADQVTIGPFEGVFVALEDSEGQVITTEEQPYTAEPYVEGSNLQTVRLVVPKPESLPATLYLHLISYSADGRQSKFKKVINGGVPLVHAQYAIATVEVTEENTAAPSITDFSVDFVQWVSDVAGVPLGETVASWTPLPGRKIYGLYYFKGASLPATPDLWKTTNVNVFTSPVTFWIDPISENTRLYFCLVYQDTAGVLLPADFGSALPTDYIDLVPPKGLDPTKLDPTPPPPPTNITIALSATAFLDAYALAVDWEPGTPIGTLAGHEWQIQHYKDMALTLPDGDPIRGYQPSSAGSEASVYVGRRPSANKYCAQMGPDARWIGLRPG